jgi:hypothetical protein
MLRHLVAAAFLLLLAAATSQAAPPEGADPDSPTGQWFQSLARMDGMSCCAVSDCRPAAPDELRSNSESGLEVRVESAWVEVPEYKIVRRDDNPLGKTIICRAHAEVYCVVPYTGL